MSRLLPVLIVPGVLAYIVIDDALTAYPALWWAAAVMLVAFVLALFVGGMARALRPASPAVRAIFEHRERMAATTTAPAPTLAPATTTTTTTTTDELGDFCKDCMAVVVGEGYPFRPWGTPGWSVTAVIKHLVRKANGVPVAGGNRFGAASAHLDKLHERYEQMRESWEREQPDVSRA